jgi:hypothetical protein
MHFSYGLKIADGGSSSATQGEYSLASVLRNPRLVGRQMLRRVTMRDLQLCADDLHGRYKGFQGTRHWDFETRAAGWWSAQTE